MRIAATAVIATAVFAAGSCYRPDAAPPRAPATAPLPAPAPALQLRSFWEGRAGPTFARPQCTEEAMAAIRSRVSRSPRARAEAWAALEQTCMIGENIYPSIEIAQALLDYAGSLLQAGYPNDCSRVMGRLTPAYGMAYLEPGDPDEDLAKAVDTLAERCKQGHEQQRAAFRPSKCPGESCLELVDDPRDPPPSAGAAEGSACKVLRYGARVLYAEEGPLHDARFCCTLETLSLAAQGDRRYVRVQGQSSCPGAWYGQLTDAVYRIEGEWLLLQIDNSLIWY